MEFSDDPRMLWTKNFMIFQEELFLGFEWCARPGLGMILHWVKSSKHSV